MNKKILLSLLPILLAAGLAGRAEAYTALGQVGQSTDVGAWGVAGSSDTGLGAVSSSISGTVNDLGYLGSSSTFSSQARAASGTVGTYIDLSYSNGGGYQASASAYSGDILAIFDLAHANQQVGITFEAVVHGTMTSPGSGIVGSTWAQLAYGEYGGTPTLGGVPGWYNGPSSQEYLIYDNMINGTSISNAYPASFTYYLTLDSNGLGSVAALLSQNTLVTTEGPGWSATSSGSLLADYYNTVSMSVRSQFDTTTITSQGGWNVVNTIPVSPVPEPETYAMLLAGLGLIGFIARRKNQNGTMNFA